MIISFSRYWIFSVPSNAAHSWAVRNEHNQLLYIRNTAVPRNFVPGRPVMMQVSDFITLPDSWAVYVLGTGQASPPFQRTARRSCNRTTLAIRNAARASQPLRFALGVAAEVEVNPEVPR